MAEPRELEARLSRLAAEVAWPAEPDLRPRVRSVLLVPRRRWFESRWVLAAVAVLAILATLLAYTPTRTAIADFVNLHTRISHSTALPTPSPLPPGPIGRRLGLGGATTLENARAHVHWTVLVPGSLGPPDEVYLQLNVPSGGEVTLVYGPQTGIPVAGETGAGVLVTEARGRVDEEFFGKLIGAGTTVTPVTVAGHQGWWIAGEPHFVYLIDDRGMVREETLRLAVNTLILDVDGTVVRIEGNLTERQAEQIAASLA